MNPNPSEVVRALGFYSVTKRPESLLKGSGLFEANALSAFRSTAWSGFALFFSFRQRRSVVLYWQAV